MILINLNQLLKKIVNEFANENNVTLNEKIVEQVEFEISAEKSRGDFATSCCLKLAKHFKKKPVELAEMAINTTTLLSNIILDLFGGSGSTLIAAERTNRHAYLMELDPKYCDVIVKRWEDFTGNTAKRVSSN